MSNEVLLGLLLFLVVAMAALLFDLDLRFERWWDGKDGKEGEE